MSEYKMIVPFDNDGTRSPIELYDVTDMGDLWIGDYDSRYEAMDFFLGWETPGYEIVEELKTKIGTIYKIMA